MAPAGHVGVIVCGTRRAERWRVAFAAEGIAAQVEETDAEDAAQGACRVTVPRTQLLVANAMITEVTQGRRGLPGERGRAIDAAIVLGVAAILIAALRFWG